MACNGTADCKSLATIDLLGLNQEEGHAGVGKIIIFICGKSIVVFHCSSFACCKTFPS